MDAEVKSSPAGQTELSIAWQRPLGMFGLSFVNLALRIVTFGIYHFWAKTEVRQRIWSAIRINDEPLTYTGKGKELFLGFLIVMGVIFLPAVLLVAAVAFAFGPQHLVTNAVSAVIYILFGFLFGLAIYRAQRYRLARTRWRGIRGALDGNPLGYAWTFFWTALLVPFTLGWIMPWRSTKLQSIITNNTRFGDRPLRFDARSAPLYGPFAVAWIGGIVTYLALIGGIGALFLAKIQARQQHGVPFVPSAREIGIVIAAILIAGVIFALVTAWYRARTINHFARHTHFEGSRFDANLSAIGLIWISVTNFLIMVAGALLLGGLVLGAALPFINRGNTEEAGLSLVGNLVVPLVPLGILLGLTLFTPITQARSAGYLVRHLAIDGSAPIDEIAQAAGSDVRYGEGLAEAFDVDAI
jgi:uncharacterized membrane protein YjgN (DUF898 family)